MTRSVYMTSSVVRTSADATPRMPAAGRRAIASARVVIAATCCCACLATPAHALGPVVDAVLPGRWGSIGGLTGAAQFDGHLADYQWNVTPRASLGVQALAGVGRVSAGVRVSQSRTTQHIAQASVSDPSVHATRFDLEGRAQLFKTFGLRLDAFGTIGRLHLGYAPSHVTLAAPGGGSDIEVGLAPVDTWSSGMGFALRRHLPGPWSAGVEIARQQFALDTAHRSGNSIVLQHERFSEWSTRLELARVYGRR